MIYCFYIINYIETALYKLYSIKLNYLYILFYPINYVTGITIAINSNELVFVTPLKVKRAETPKMSFLKRP